jgi:hypothetical protein
LQKRRQGKIKKKSFTPTSLLKTTLKSYRSLFKEKSIARLKINNGTAAAP